MAKDYFRFKQFTVHQELCGMKVGTDSTLLGAWAKGGNTVLDIGTGTGLLAMMMAQRFAQAVVTAIDIDSNAVRQAIDNIAASPFASRISVVEIDARRFECIDKHKFSTSSDHSEGGLAQKFEAIVCNPPYFVNSLESPDAQRTLARHACMLSYSELISIVKRLLTDNGEFSVVIPFDSKDLLEREAVLQGLFKVRQCAVRTTPRKMPRRYLMAFSKHYREVETEEGTIEEHQGKRSEWYKQMTDDFYL